MSYLNNIQNKIVDKLAIKDRVNQWKNENKKVVFTNGCFDLLHKGHVQYLATTADLGDKLVVGLNSDRSVKQLGKGDLRPIKDQETRALILSAFEFVDAVVIFDEETPYSLIEVIVPDVIAKGGDWKKQDIVGADIVENNGGVVKSIKFIEGYSTTNYVEKIQHGEG